MYRVKVILKWRPKLEINFLTLFLGFCVMYGETRAAWKDIHPQLGMYGKVLIYFFKYHGTSTDALYVASPYTVKDK